MKVNQCKADTSSQKKLSSDGNLSYGDTIVEIGRLFINVPYKAGTLENLGKEKLIINVSGFDCTTFVETVLALTNAPLPENFHVLNSEILKINPLSSGKDRWLFLPPALLYRLAARQ